MARKATYAVLSNPAPAEGGLQLLFTGQSQTEAGHRLGPKVFDHYLIHYVERGQGIYSVGGWDYALQAGDSFVIYPDVLVSYASDESDPWAYRWIAFKGESAGGLLEAAGISPEAPIIHTEPGVARRFERVMRLFREKPVSVNLRAGGELHLLMADYADAARTPDASDASYAASAQAPGAILVRQAIHYMTTQYAEPMSIELMAESLGYNRAYLSRLFRRHTGVTPIAFLVQLRLDRARRLLRERMELTVEQVASSVGFADALYFSKQFRSAYGQSPTEYRASVKKYERPQVRDDR